MVLEVDAGSQVEARARDRSDADPGPGSASEEPLLKVLARNGPLVFPHTAVSKHQGDDDKENRGDQPDANADADTDAEADAGAKRRPIAPAAVTAIERMLGIQSEPRDHFGLTQNKY